MNDDLESNYAASLSMGIGLGQKPDLREIEGLPKEKVAVLVNKHVSASLEALNRSAAMSERTFMKVDEKIRRMDIALSLLETKLSEVVVEKESPPPT
eukprot:Nk52_evm1s2621 gene=Nk52_evmTU1s2621